MTTTSKTIASDFAAEINAAVAAGKVTKLPDAPAKGLNMKDAAQTLSKPTKAQKAAGTPTVTRKEVKVANAIKDVATKGSKKDVEALAMAIVKGKGSLKEAATAAVNKKAPAPKAKDKKAATPAAAGNTITPAMIAAKYDVTAKALRARMRKHADKWAKVMSTDTRAKGEAYVIRDNATNWKAIDALMAK